MGKCQGSHCVGSAIVNCDPSSGLVEERCTWEDHIGHIQSLVFEPYDNQPELDYTSFDQLINCSKLDIDNPERIILLDQYLGLNRAAQMAEYLQLYNINHLVSELLWRMITLCSLNRNKQVEVYIK
jgi:hypothetical protein